MTSVSRYLTTSNRDLHPTEQAHRGSSSTQDIREGFMPIHAMKHGWAVLVYLGNVRGVGDDAEEVEREPAEAEGEGDGDQHHVGPG